MVGTLSIMQNWFSIINHHSDIKQKLNNNIFCRTEIIPQNVFIYNISKLHLPVIPILLVFWTYLSPWTISLCTRNSILILYETPSLITKVSFFNFDKSPLRSSDSSGLSTGIRTRRFTITFLGLSGSTNKILGVERSKKNKWWKISLTP